MKKLMMWLAMFVVAGTSMAVDDYVTDGSVRYGMNTSIYGNVSIVSATFLEDIQQLKIPETHNDNPVVSIIASVFTYASLDEVIFPSTLESLGERAFRNADLKSITFKEQAALEEGEVYELKICKEAFDSCDELQRVIFEGLPPTTVEENAFPVTKGYYTKKYAKEWEAALAGETTWNNLTMACWDTDLVDTGTLIYNIEADDTITIRGVSEGFSAETLELPSTIDGKTIAKIDDLAFYNCATLKRIVFSEGLKEIGTYAFYRCTALESVAIPSTVTKIGEDAFEACTALPVVDEIRYESAAQRVVVSAYAVEGAVELPTSVWFIMNEAFGTRQQLTAITLPKGIKNYGRGVFYNCTNLASVTLPSDMTAIPEGMFKECYALASIELPEGVQSIEKEAFSSCRELESINLPENVQTIGESAFYGCIFESIEIPSSVKKIGANAFQSTALRTVTIPSTVEEIGEAALDSCYSLTSVTLPENMTTIPDYFLGNSENLTKFEIPATVKNIGKYAFQGSGLRELSIPATVETLGEGAFSRCQYLPYVLFEGGAPGTDAAAPVAAFDEGLLGAYFPHNRTAWEAEGVIVDGVWQNLTMFCYDEDVDPAKLYKYEVIEGEEETVTITGLSEEVLHAGAFEIPATVVIDGEEKKVTAISANAFDSKCQVTSVVIPEGVTTIGSYAFNWCPALHSVTIPETVVSIGEYAFDGCTALPVYDGIVYESEAKTVAIGTRRDGGGEGQGSEQLTALELPDTVRVIMPYAFQSGSLQIITLPASVDVIGDYALNPWGLLMVIFKGEPPTNVGERAFPEPQDIWDEETQTTKCVYVEGYYCTDAKDAWETEGVITEGIWNGLKMHGLSAAGSFENADLFTYTDNTDGTLTVTGLSEVVHIGAYELPAEVDGKAVTAIADDAFAGSVRIQEFTLPDSVITLGNDVFAGCEFLPEENGVRYESAAKKVLVKVLYTNEDNMTEGTFTIPDSVRFIHAYAFQYIEVSTVIVPESVVSINANAFAENYGWITRIVFEGLPPVAGGQIIEEGVEAVGEYTHSEWGEVISAEGTWYGLTMINTFTPDLVIEDLKLSTLTNEGTYFFPTDHLALTFRVRNQGQLASAETSLTITLNGETLETEPLPALGIDDYTDYVKYYTVAEYSDAHTLSVTLDSPGTVPELDEENNTQSLIFSIVDPIQTWAYFTEDEENHTITLTGATVVKAPDNVMEIPATLSGKPIVAIGDNAFDGFDNIKTLIIPASVTSIGASAFKGCTNLQNLIIADEGEALTIGAGAFNGTALKSLTLPARVTAIGPGAFTNCTHLTKVYFKGTPPTVSELETDASPFNTEGAEGYFNEDEATVKAWEAVVEDTEGMIWHGLKMVQINVTIPEDVEKKPAVKKWLKEVALAEEGNDVEITLAEDTTVEKLDAARLLGIKPIFKTPVTPLSTFSTFNTLNTTTTVVVSINAELHVSELNVDFDNDTVSLTITVKAEGGTLEEGYHPTVAPKIYGRKTLNDSAPTVLAQTLPNNWTRVFEDGTTTSTEATQTIKAPLADYTFFQAISEEE